MTKQQNDTEMVTYTRILLSFIEGMMRFWSAESVSSRLSATLASYKADASNDSIEGKYRAMLSWMDGISRERFEAHTHVVNASHLVYATSIFDTFLSETTLFMLLRNPGSIGGKRQVLLEDVLDAASLVALVNGAALKRAREIAYQSFQDRISFLGGTFGLRFTIDSNLLEKLERYAMLRNLAVHDQGTYELKRTETGTVVADERPGGGLVISNDDPLNAADTYGQIGTAIAESILTNVLACPDHPLILGMKRIFRDRSVTNPFPTDPRDSI